jgi:hypothetical protein
MPVIQAAYFLHAECCTLITRGRRGSSFTADGYNSTPETASDTDRRTYHIHKRVDQVRHRALSHGTSPAMAEGYWILCSCARR